MEYFTNTITDLYENYTKHPIIFIAITEKSDLKPNMMRIFLEKIHIPKLNLQQRYEMLQWYACAMDLNMTDGLLERKKPNKETLIMSGKQHLNSYVKDVLYRVASKTETFVHGDLDTLVHFAMRESYLKQIACSSYLSRDPNLSYIQEEDFNKALGLHINIYYKIVKTKQILFHVLLDSRDIVLPEHGLHHIRYSAAPPTGSGCEFKPSRDPDHSENFIKIGSAI